MIDAGDSTAALGPNISTLGVSSMFSQAFTMALCASGVCTTPSTSTLVVSPRPPPNSSSSTSNTSSIGESSGRKSVKLNVVSRLTRPQVPSPPTPTASVSIRAGTRSANTATRPMSVGSSRSLE